MADDLITLSSDSTEIGPAERLVERAREYAQASQSPNTRRAYESAFRRWCQWCAEMNVSPLPPSPEAVAFYLTHLADIGRAWATINTAMAAIEYYSKTNGHGPVRSSLEVSLVGKGIRRTHGVAQVGARALTIEQLRAVCDKLAEQNTWYTTRDRAMLLLGFAGAFRRSELVSLDVRDLQRDAEHGFVVTLRRSKTDQDGLGFLKGIPFGGRRSTCPVRAIDSWLEVHPDKTGPLFVRANGDRLGAWSVNRVLQDSMARAALDVTGHSAHSLRAGFITAAARANKRLDQIMSQTGHKSVEVAMRYIRTVDLFRENPAEGLGL